MNNTDITNLIWKTWSSVWDQIENDDEMVILTSNIITDGTWNPISNVLHPIRDLINITLTENYNERKNK